MSETKHKKVIEAFGLVILAVILIPIASGLVADAGINGTAGTVLTLLPTLLLLIVVLAMFRDNF